MTDRHPNEIPCAEAPTQPPLEPHVPSEGINLDAGFCAPEIVDESIYPRIITCLHALGYYAAVSEYQFDPYLRNRDRQSPNYGHIIGIKPFIAPTVQDALDAYSNLVRINSARWRADYMAGRALRAIIVHDSETDTERVDDQLFNTLYGPGAGACAYELYESMAARRRAEASQAATALKTRQPDATEPVTVPLNTAGGERVIWTQKELKRAILAEYEDGFRGLFDASTKKVDLSRLPEDQKMSAARLLAGIQNAIYDHLAQIGELPEGAVYITEEDAGQMLLQPGFIEEAGGIRIGKFSRRARTLPVLGAGSLDAQFEKPGLTRTAVEYALEDPYAQEEARASTMRRTIGQAWVLSQRRAAAMQPETTDEPAVTMSLEKEAAFTVFGEDFENKVRSRFGGLPIDDMTIRRLFHAACFSDNEYAGGSIYGDWRPSDSGRISNRSWWLSLRKEMQAMLYPGEDAAQRGASPLENDDLFAGEWPDITYGVEADESVTDDTWGPDLEAPVDGALPSRPDEFDGSVGPRQRAQTYARALHTTGQRVTQLPPESVHRQLLARLKAAMSRPRRAS